MLSACSDLSVKRSNPEGNRIDPTSQVTTPAESPSPTRPSSQPFNATNSTAKTTPSSPSVGRDNYKPISLSQTVEAKALTGDDPKAIALSAFGNIESEGGSRDVTVEYPQPERAIVTITQTGVADDSVGGIRYRVELQQNKKAPTGRQWEMVWVGSQVKCHPNRGHQDWSKELCL